MRKHYWFVLLICIALLGIGCGKDRAKSDSEQQQSETEQTASAPPSAVPEPVPPEPATAPPAEPPATPTAKKPAVKPPAQKPAPAKAAAPVPQAIVVPAGTAIAVRTTDAISSETSKPGETFEASLAEPLVVGGTTAAPAGATATGKIVKAASAGRMKGEGVLSLALTSLNVKGRAYSVTTEPVTQTSKSRGKRSATMIGGGAGAGALIGGLAGGGKGAAIGALAGGAAGTAGATMTGKRDVVVPPETVLSFRLSAPLKLQ